MNRLKKGVGGFDALAVVRYLLLAELVFLCISTSLAVIVDSLFFLLFVAFSSLRSRVVSIIRQPMVIMSLVWAVVVSIGLLYSVGPASENLDIWSSWRKILLIPMAAAIFDAEEWKRKLVWTLIGVTMFGVAVSYCSWFFDIALLKKEPVSGIVVHNHATQGILFAVGAFAAAIMLRLAPPVSRGWRWFLAAGVAGIAANILFITHGRSGYLVFLVFSMLVPFFLLKGWPRYLFSVVVPLAFGLVMYYSPVASQRIMQGVDEMRTYEQGQELTSMGIRMVMWENTLQLIKERPIFGYGTGGFIEGYRQQVEGKKGWREQVVADPHNQFLRIAAEQGLIGLLLFLLLIGAFFRQRVELPWRYLGIGVLLAWCASSLFSAHFSTFVEGRFVWLWCGGLLSVIGRKKDTAAP